MIKKIITRKLRKLMVFLLFWKLVGNNLTLADLACIASITSGLAFIPISKEKYPKLTAWTKLMEKLPYYQEINQKGVDELNTLLFGFIETNKNLK